MQIKKALSSMVIVIIILAVLVPTSSYAGQEDRATRYRFADVADNTWYTNAVNYCAGRKYMSGYNYSTFKPNNTITRAEMATIMTSMLKLDLKASNTFTDVKNGKWYTEPILKCVKAGIMSGYSNTQFGPSDTLTREQGAVILAKAFNVGKATGRTTFSDDAKISKWAVGSVKAMVAKGLITGVGNNRFSPNTTMTRAQVSQIIYADSATKKFIDKTKTSPQTDWGKAYIDVIQQYRSEHGSDAARAYSLIFVDEDSIPELAIEGISEALGYQITTYHNGKASSQNTDRLSFQYKEKQNQLLNSTTSMGIGREHFYIIKDGNWEKTEYGNIRYKDGQGEGNPPETIWTWNGKDVSESEYEESINAICKSDDMIMVDNRYDYSNILLILRGTSSSENKQGGYKFDVDDARQQILDYYSENTTIKYESDTRYLKTGQELDKGNTYQMSLFMWWYPEEEARREAQGLINGGRLLTTIQIDKATGKVTDDMDGSPSWYLK